MAGGLDVQVPNGDRFQARLPKVARLLPPTLRRASLHPSNAISGKTAPIVCVPGQSAFRRSPERDSALRVPPLPLLKSLSRGTLEGGAASDRLHAAKRPG